MDALNRRFLVKTSDGQQMVVGESVISKSRLYLEMFKHLRLEDGTNDEPLKFDEALPMTSATLERVVAWCDDAVGYKGPVEPRVQLDPVTHERVWFHLADFEKDFFRSIDSLEALDELLDAALFLNIKSLLLLLGQTVAGYIKNATAEEIRDWFGIPNDLTPERVEEIRQSDPWNPLVRAIQPQIDNEQPEINAQPDEDGEPDDQSDGEEEPEVNEQPEKEEDEQQPAGEGQEIERRD